MERLTLCLAPTGGGHATHRRVGQIQNLFTKIGEAFRRSLFRNSSDRRSDFPPKFMVDPALGGWQIKLHKIPAEAHVLSERREESLTLGGRENGYDETFRS